MALVRLRAGAEARLADTGLPNRRQEYWRYTDPAPLLAPPPAAPLSEPEPLFGAVDRLTVTFTDGVLDGLPPSEPGLELSALSDAAWADALVGTLEAAGQRAVPRPLAALNGTRAIGGLAIRVTGRAARPIHIQYRRTRPDADIALRHVVHVAPGADVTLLETGLAGARSNIVTEVDVAETGRFHHIRVQGPDAQRQVVSALFARLGAGALAKSFTLSAQGALTRNEAVIDLAGDDAVVHVAGAALGDGAAAPVHHDDTVFVTHGGLRGESRQVFKKMLRGGAVGVFQGKILVKPGAQKTDGYQISQALLLDEASQFLAKPELEIYADDVKCSHGSTTGAIDETALFYLRARGVPRDRAVVLLVLSFLAAALDEIADESLRAEISDQLERWLGAQD